MIADEVSEVTGELARRDLGPVHPNARSLVLHQGLYEHGNAVSQTPKLRVKHQLVSLECHEGEKALVVKTLRLTKQVKQVVCLGQQTDDDKRSCRGHPPDRPELADHVTLGRHRHAVYANGDALTTPSEACGLARDPTQSLRRGLRPRAIKRHALDGSPTLCLDQKDGVHEARLSHSRLCAQDKDAWLVAILAHVAACHTEQGRGSNPRLNWLSLSL